MQCARASGLRSVRASERQCARNVRAPEHQSVSSARSVYLRHDRRLAPVRQSASAPEASERQKRLTAPRPSTSAPAHVIRATSGINRWQHVRIIYPPFRSTRESRRRAVANALGTRYRNGHYAWERLDIDCCENWKPASRCVVAGERSTSCGNIRVMRDAWCVVREH